MILKNEAYMQAFARRMRIARERTGMTRHEAADKIGVSYATLSGWELAITAPHISIIIPIAQVLNVSVAWLMTGRRRNEGMKR